MVSVELLKTTVSDRAAAETVATQLRQLFPAWRITFDLEDCDRILRIEGPALWPQLVIAHLHRAGHQCVLLE